MDKWLAKWNVSFLKIIDVRMFMIQAELTFLWIIETFRKWLDSDIITRELC